VLVPDFGMEFPLGVETRLSKESNSTSVALFKILSLLSEPENA